MLPSLPLSIAAASLILGLLALAAAPSRGPPPGPPGAERAKPLAAPGTPPAWVCVTPGGYCTSPPRRSGEPCTCLDSWRGWLPGRVLAERAPAPPRALRWPSRPVEGGEDEPAGTWLAAP